MRIKQIPEDFQVKEVLRLPKEQAGDYLYVLLKKRRRSTLDVVEDLAHQLRMTDARIGFAGTKDKEAVTEQYLSLYKVTEAQLKKVRLADCQMDVVGHGTERLTLGALRENEFAITVRDLEEEGGQDIRYLVNYFDDQRFGQRKDNHQVGKALVKKRFDEACRLLGLAAHGRDYLGALKALGLRRLRLLVHSYQSYLFNEAVNRYIRQRYPQTVTIPYALGELSFPVQGYEETLFPLPGFLTEWKGSSEFYEPILRQEGIVKEDFIIRPFPELSAEGGERPLFVEVMGFQAESRADELNKGKRKRILMFRLPKGSYATLVVKVLFQEAAARPEGPQRMEGDLPLDR